MKSISTTWMVVVMLLSSVYSFAQIKNETVETVKVNGNCGMCKKTIEKAGNLKNVAHVEWDENTQVATLKYDSSKTSQAEILKRIVLAGYDNEKFSAPDDVYSKLHGCCQYDRDELVTDAVPTEGAGANVKHVHNVEASTVAPSTSPLSAVFNSYFLLKDALVGTDAALATVKAKELVKVIGNVDMAKLTTADHAIWMNVVKDITANAEQIVSAKNIAKQREAFSSLSNSMYDLGKVSKLGEKVYYMHCPMYNNGKGANWLSKEEQVKNPYYGSQMLTCGSVKGTIGK